MYKILSLDGGGSWSVLQLLTLKEKYGDKTGHEILRDYDMVIANSGGSIVLAALAENWTPDKALSLFRDKKTRERIFSKNRFAERFFPVDFLGTAFGPKYSTKRKGHAFSEIFENVNRYQMEDLPAFIGKPSLKLMVCTYDALNNKAKFFKSWHADRTYPFDSVRLTQAIHGSSNAPVLYFDFPARFKAKNSEIFYELWDGALGGFNNPVVAGVIEAVKSGVNTAEMKIISIGTGNKTMSYKAKEDFYNLKETAVRERFKKWKFWRWKYQLRFFKSVILNQAKTILYTPPDWANYVAMMFLKQAGVEHVENQFVRLCMMVHIDNTTDPSVVELLNRLYRLDMDITEDSDMNTLIEGYENWKLGLIKNQPLEFHINRDNELVYLQGDKLFRDALNRW